MNWIDVLTVTNLVLIIGVFVGGYVAIRSGFARSGQELQEHVRQALHDENELLTAQLLRQQAENKHKGQQLDLVLEMLKKLHHIDVEFTDGMITLRDSTGTHTARLKSGQAAEDK